MKRFILTLTTIFICTIAYAHTINWYVGDTILETTTCDSGESITPPTAPYKYGYHFVEWIDYRPIEYLESTGTQYIDTGYIPDKDTYIEIDTQYTSIDIGNEYIADSITGCRQTGFSDRFYPVAIYNNSQLRHVYGSTELYSNEPLNRHYIKFNDIEHKVFVDDVFIGNLSNYVAPNISLKTFWIFCANNENPKRYVWCSAKKVYLLKIYNNNILVRDFIPVLDKDGVPCMFDKVEGKFYYNAGTGQFIAGPVIGE